MGRVVSLRSNVLISNLHALRAIASLMVVLHHARGMIEVQFPQLSILTIGASGVDIFFVLSGVVITLSAHARPVPATVFLRQRIVRVVPLWWLALSVLFVMLLVGLAPLGLQSGDVTPLNILRSIAFVPFERAHGAIMPLLGVGWTLNYEIFFYAVFAGLVCLPEPRRSLILAAVLVTVVLSGVYFQPQTAIAYFYTNPILLEFAAGVLLARLWIKLPDVSNQISARCARRVGVMLILVGLTGFIFGARPPDYSELMPYRAIIWGLPAVACVAGAMALERGGLRLASRGWMIVGGASYALYLFHPFILQAVAKFGDVAAAGPIAAFAIFGTAVVVSQLFAIVIHVWIEGALTNSFGSLLFRRVAPLRPSRAIE
jgi:exopolysaccharide production protein ExoZ